MFESFRKPKEKKEQPRVVEIPGQGKATLSPEELKQHEEVLRKQRILNLKAGEEAVKQTEEELGKSLEQKE